MKTTKFILIAFLVFTTLFSIEAQIKVTNTGNIGIGTLTPSTTKKVTIQGDNIFLRSNYNTNNGLQLQYDWENEAYDLSPTSNGSNTIGLNKRFQEIYGFDIVGFYGYFTDLYCNRNFYNYSDIKLKKNINSLSFDKSVFSKLHPVSYIISDSLLIADRDKQTDIKISSIQQYGFIAQEIQSLYPQLVDIDVKTGYLKIKPLEFIPILVSAIIDQQVQIDTQAKLIEELKALYSNSGFNKIGASNSTTILESDVFTYPVLEQNNPNPFNVSTAISYYLPVTITTAAIYIYDMNGAQLKSYPIAERGKGNLIIKGLEYPAGMYLYALITNGNVIDTKRMILTK